MAVWNDRSSFCWLSCRLRATLVHDWLWAGTMASPSAVLSPADSVWGWGWGSHLVQGLESSDLCPPFSVPPL